MLYNLYVSMNIVYMCAYTSLEKIGSPDQLYIGLRLYHKSGTSIDYSSLCIHGGSWMAQIVHSNQTCCHYLQTGVCNV